MFKIIKKSDDLKFSLFYDNNLLTSNISFPEVENDEKIILENLEEFEKYEIQNIDKKNILSEIKKYFVLKYGKPRKILKNKNLKIVKKEKWINKWNKILLILSWVPGSWKSSWVSENNLERFVVSSDSLRLLYSKVELWLDPLEQISQIDNKKIFKKYFEIIEEKMKKEEFIVCDATHLLEKSFDRYIEFAIKYDYEINIKIFDEDNLEVLLERNKKRWYKEVSKEVLEKFLERKKSFFVPDFVREIKKVKDLSNYNLDFKKVENDVFYIWDIQGCPIELKKFLEKYYNENDYFVFCGDLLDRGYDNAWVLDLISEIIDNPKVILIKWNHDLHLEKYFKTNRKEKSWSRIFDDETSVEIADYPFEKIWKIVNKFVYACSFQIWWKKVFACHGWVSKVNDFISNKQLIKWVWLYEEYQKCDEVFEKWSLSQKEQFFCVHGHRNSLEVQTKSTKRTFNLEWKVEFWWKFRIVRFFSDWKSEIIEIKSSVEKKDFKNENFLKTFSKNNFINIKDLWNGLFSINFTRKAFYEKNWDSETIKARWLFIWENDEIFARSYDKFFNVGERKETEPKNLAKNFVFPVSAYKKYNWFLWIIWLKDEKVLYLSKTSDKSDFSLLVKKHLEKYEEKMKKYLKQGFSLIFEICDNDDKHIIFEKERPILIEVVENTLDYFSKKSYEDLEKIWKDLWVEVKKKEAILQNEKELLDFIEKAKYVDFEWFILEWSAEKNPFLTKTKSYKYLFWKEIRTDIEKIKKGKNATHKEIFEKLKEKNIDFFNLSIPDLIEKSKDLNFLEIPKRKNDKE